MRLLCLILVVIGLDVARASAAKIYLDRDEIVLKGEIKFGDSQKFKKIIDQIYRKSYLQPIDGVTQRDRSSPRNIKRIRLTSIGGRVGEALEIGHYIRTHNVATYVPKGKCYSACALLWLAGRSKFRHPASSIGFHRTFDRKTGRAIGNAIVGFYLSEMGYSYNTARFVTKASPKKLTYLTEQNKSEAGITIKRKSFPLWQQHQFTLELQSFERIMKTSNPSMQQFGLHLRSSCASRMWKATLQMPGKNLEQISYRTG